MKYRLNELVKSAYDMRRILICIACVFGLGWISVCRDIGTGAQLAFASNLTGLCIFPMIIIRFKPRDFLKIPYLIWLVVFSAFCYPAFRLMDTGTDYNGQIASAILNVGLYGFVLIRMLYYLISEKKCELNKLTPVFWLWVGMIFFCIISRNEALWPIWFAVMIGAYYLAPIDRKGVEEMVLGIVDGIILSFFWIQCRAFLYCAYDRGPGYYGHFTNKSVNAMFYLSAYIAVLCRFAYAWRREKRNKLECTLLFLLTCSLWDFMYITGSRGGLLALLSVSFVYLVVEMLMKPEGSVRRFFVTGTAMVLLFVLLFVPVYACARYIPALRHHPIWYDDYSPSRVHSWDPIDSPKYTTLRQAIGEGVVAKMSEWLFANSFIYASVLKSEQVPGGTWVLEYSDGVKPGSDSQHSALIVNRDETGDTIGFKQMGFLQIRRYIYRYFLENLNFFGRKPAHMYVYVGFECGHAHNSFLQIAFYHGIFAGLFFIAVALYSPIYIIKNKWNSKLNRNLPKAESKAVVRNRWVYLFPMLFLTGFTVFGLTDCTVFVGELLFIGFFLCLLPLIKNLD